MEIENKIVFSNAPIQPQKTSPVPCYKRFLHYIWDLLATLFYCGSAPLKNRVTIYLPEPVPPTIMLDPPLIRTSSPPLLPPNPKETIEENIHKLWSKHRIVVTPKEENSGNKEDRRSRTSESPVSQSEEIPSVHYPPPNGPQVLDAKKGVQTLFGHLSSFDLTPSDLSHFSEICKALKLENFTLEASSKNAYVFTFKTSRQKEEIQFAPPNSEMLFKGTSLFRSLLEARLSSSMDKTLSARIAHQLIPQNCTQVLMRKEKNVYKLIFSLENPFEKKFNGKILTSLFSTSFEFVASYENTINATLDLSENSALFTFNQGFCLIRTQNPLGWLDVVHKGIVSFVLNSSRQSVKPFLPPLQEWRDTGYKGELSLRFPSMGFQANKGWNNVINFSCTSEMTQNQKTTQIPHQEGLWVPGERISTFFEEV